MAPFGLSMRTQSNTRLCADITETSHQNLNCVTCQCQLLKSALNLPESLTWAQATNINYVLLAECASLLVALQIMQERARSVKLLIMTSHNMHSLTQSMQATLSYWVCSSSADHFCLTLCQNTVLRECDPSVPMSLLQATF